MEIKLDVLFDNCANKVKYSSIGNDVNYAFVEKKDVLYIYFQGSNSITLN